MTECSLLQRCNTDSVWQKNQVCSLDHDRFRTTCCTYPEFGRALLHPVDHSWKQQPDQVR